MKYYIGPVHNLHNVRAVPIRILEGGDLMTVESAKYGTFRTPKRFVVSSSKDAAERLRDNCEEHKKDIDDELKKSIKKLLEDIKEAL